LTTPPPIVEDRAIGTDAAQAAPPAPRRFWLWLLVAGAVIWAVATAITAVTEDTILVPTVILIGSFLVPICTVAFALGRADATNLSPGVLLVGFVVGGTLAMPLTALTETLLLPSQYGTFAAVGLIEETGKGLVLLVLALHGAWDASYGWAVILTRGLVGDGWSVGWPNTEGWVGQPAGNTLLVFNVTYTMLQLINSVIGFAWVVHRWRSRGRV
jgi:hypothetical protein